MNTLYMSTSCTEKNAVFFGLVSTSKTKVLLLRNGYYTITLFVCVPIGNSALTLAGCVSFEIELQKTQATRYDPMTLSPQILTPPTHS